MGDFKAVLKIHLEMGALEQAIKAAIAAQIDRMRIIDVFSGTAINVGETTCDVARDNAPLLHAARLNAIDDNLESYVTIYPAEGSSVVVARLEGLSTEAVVLRCSEVSAVKMKIGENVFVLNADGFVFNQGSNKGLVKVTEMVGWMQKVYADMQKLKALLYSTPIAGNGSPAAIQFNPTTPAPEVSVLENVKVKH